MSGTCHVPASRGLCTFGSPNHTASLFISFTLRHKSSSNWIDPGRMKWLKCRPLPSYATTDVPLISANIRTLGGWTEKRRGEGNRVIDFLTYVRFPHGRGMRNLDIIFQQLPVIKPQRRRGNFQTDASSSHSICEIFCHSWRRCETRLGALLRSVFAIRVPRSSCAVGLMQRTHTFFTDNVSATF